ncbi:MAG TPA: hypothetical protein ACFE0H_00570 [Elainellaceae cyanobacterium]|jgi:hypothetical protein
MKRLFTIGVSALLISMAASLTAMTAKAEVIGANPADLVYLAYQGYLTEQGIPRYGRLINDLHTRQVTVDDVIEAGIQANRISEDARTDQSYRHAVRLQIRGLVSNDNGV